MPIMVITLGPKTELTKVNDGDTAARVMVAEAAVSLGEEKKITGPLVSDGFYSVQCLDGMLVPDWVDVTLVLDQGRTEEQKKRYEHAVEAGFESVGLECNCEAVDAYRWRFPR
jgi:hypothetical protein